MFLKSLVLKNFKGLESFALAPNGNNVTNIFGANAKGKTTIMDAFTWLLFDKDSLNRADFDIKALDAAGDAAHGLEHMVEAVLINGNGETTLKKMFQEKWVKRRGAATKEFTGHTAKCWIDGVPVKKKEYTARVSEICDETIFQLLANPRFFNEQLDTCFRTKKKVPAWQARRTLLLEVCGDISDADVIASDSALEELPDIMGKHSLSDLREIIKSRKAEINKEIETLPVRIDEVLGQKVDDLPPIKEIMDDINIAIAARKAAESEKAEIEAGGMDGVLTTRIREIDNEISRIDSEQAAKDLTETQERNKKGGRLEVAAQDAALEVRKAKGELLRLTAIAKNTDELIEEQVEIIGDLRKRWHDDDAVEFELKQNTACPTCGQPIPNDQLEAAREKALQGFNAEKAEKLKAINRKGVEAKVRLEWLEKQKLEAAESILKAEADVETLTTAAESAEKALADYRAIPICGNAPDNPERQALVDEKAGIEEQISSNNTSIKEALKPVEDKIKQLHETTEQLERQKLKHEGNSRIDARVNELKMQERDLAAEYEKLERELFLTDQFMRTKVSMLEEHINAKFKVARFKLFDTQINEGLAECCETLSNGVPYGSMNNAARIQIGVDICDTLSEHFKKRPPLFIDNAESVTEIPATDAQQIRLIVSPEDQELRVA